MRTQITRNCLFFLCLSTSVVNCQTKVTPTSLILTTFASGLNHPVDIANAGDNRLFIVEQEGYIQIADASGNINSTPFLDIIDRVESGGEQGLLGLAFHPDYASTGFLYVNYTGVGDSTHISRFKVSPINPEMADPNSEMKLLTIFQPYQNHNGGCLKFGPDGYLYIGLGDGGSAGDPGNRAQNPMEFLGKMLRIDVDGGNPYTIPETNPYFGDQSVLNEIWAMGLRNPWRFSFDKQTGDLWIGDVGQNAIEEIDLQPATSEGGENYGWRCYEGNNPYNTDGCSAEDIYTYPVHEYDHSATNSCSVTGGFVYRASQYPNFTGKYFFADYCSDKIWTLSFENGSWIATLMGQYNGNNFSTFGEDMNGKLYIAGHTSGIIFCLSDTGTGNSSRNSPKELNIYPIPFTETITIISTITNPDPGYLNIFDATGNLVFESEINSKQTDIYLGFLPCGIYMVNLLLAGNYQADKIIKQ